MEILHGLLCSFLIICGFFVIFSLNPVESMISLILMFCISGIVLLIFNSEFLGISFIIIYVGAIAVLFLFIIMMLNIKKYSSYSISDFIKKYKLLVSLFFITILITAYLNFDLIYLLIEKTFSIKDMAESKHLSKEINDIPFDNLGNINVLGQSLFNYYILIFLLAGLILLVALVGTIILSLNFNSRKKSQITFRQLSRTDQFLSHFKK